MVDRMARVIRLDRTIFDDAPSHDASVAAAAQAVGIVALAITIGTGLQIATSELPRSANATGAMIGSLLAPFVHWLIWSALIFAVGSGAFRGVATFPATLRVIGFAMSPLALGIFSFVPVVGPVITIIGQLLSLRAGSMAVQAAHRLDPRRTIATVAVTFVVAFVLSNALRAFLTQVGFWEPLAGPFQR
jgi:hypothetical protein